MNNYIATFYSHFGAMSFSKMLQEQNITANLMPAPSKVSSSCGTCVLYRHSEYIDSEACELEGIYLETDNILENVLKK
jgi:hypothetical protein